MTLQHADGTVEFRFFRPDARQVGVAGEFNGWNPHDSPMIRDGGGWWIHRLRLTAGSHRFRYHADGQWFTDYAAFGIERGPFGWDSVVHVVSPSGRDLHRGTVEPDSRC